MKNKQFEKYVKSENNLNAVKFICAILVILHHSYPITFGPDYIDPFKRITNSQFSLGNFSVIIFLFIAGMLITMSFVKIKDYKKFFIKRITRIFPSLVVVILLTVFVIGPVFTNIDVKKYFTSINTYKYLIFNCILITNHNLTVFTNNIYNLSPNGSLWTLPVEFCCYIIIIILNLFKLLKEKIVKYYPILIMAIYLCQSIVIKYIGGFWPAVQAILFFGMGIYIYLFFNESNFSKKGFLISLVLLIVSLVLNIYSYINILLIPYIIIYITFFIKKKFKRLNNLGKYSYEIYLTGFLIQQCVSNIFNSYIKSPYFNFILSVPIIIILSIVIHRFVDVVLKKFKLII